MTHRLASMAALCIALAPALFAADAPEKTIVIPPGAEQAYDAFHYAPAVRVGDLVFVSGVPAFGAAGDPYEKRVRNMFEAIKRILTQAGADLSDVVELTSFHREVKDTESFHKEFEALLSVHREYFPAGYPAWTAVATTALLAPGAPVEMRVVAVIGSGQRTRVDRPAPRAPKP